MPPNIYVLCKYAHLYAYAPEIMLRKMITKTKFTLIGVIFVFLACFTAAAFFFSIFSFLITVMLCFTYFILSLRAMFA